MEQLARMFTWPEERNRNISALSMSTWKPRWNASEIKTMKKRTDDFAPEAHYSGNIFVTPSSLGLQYCTQQVISSRKTDVSACGRYLEVLNGAWKRDRTIKGSLVVAE